MRQHRSMSKNKRSRDFDFPPDDDPDDDDYGKPSPKKKSRQTVSPRKPQAKKKTKKHSGYRDSDIEEDSDVIEEDTEASFSAEDEEPSSSVQVTKAGHRQRSSARGLNFAESSDEEEDDPVDTSDADSDVPIRTFKNKQQQQQQQRQQHQQRQNKALPSVEQENSLIVKLAVGSGTLEAFAGRNEGDQANVSTGGKSLKALETAFETTVEQIPGDMSRPRRSSARISGNEEAALVALTNSGHHETVVRPGSVEPPSATAKQPPRAAKRLPDTSAIPEASQESDVKKSSTSDADDDDDDDELMGDDQADQTLLAKGGMSATDPASDQDADDDDDEDPVSRKGRSLRSAATSGKSLPGKSRRLRGNNGDESSDFEPGADEPEDEEEDDDVNSSPSKSPRKPNQRPDAEDRSSRRSGRLQAQKISRTRSEDEMSDLDRDELAEEARELAASRRTRKRRHASLEITYDEPSKKLRNRAERVNYNVYRPELWGNLGEDDDQTFQSAAALRNRKTGSAYRSLFSTTGPFGMVGGPPTAFGAFAEPGGPGATGGVDSDSSDDEGFARGARNVGGTAGMTPTTSGAPRGFMNQETAQGTSGAPSNLGKVGDRKALADADPLGVDQNVNFDGVGGLDSHINQLKEMVQLPLLYPEVFQRFHVTPPRGVLFHGPPGTGKTLLARALASSVSSSGRKVTFYMRKGADALSKWVGEAERQLRLLFEEARKTQPSIIFFDEIDGLAPVRSSKQEQIHASIVATLLALMDGMDGRGQVIVIGATNRPDSVDPALRRPGRFDREFFFPLPNEKSRRAIIDIHTKGWDPPLGPDFKDRLAGITKGYGGADLRALCTEAALNAVQGTYPQIYESNEKLIIDASKIKVLAKDFMISVNKMIPSSERSAPTGAAPLEASVEPLLRNALKQISDALDDILPETKKRSALEEALFDDRDDENGFEKEILQQNFDRARVFRPRLLIYGLRGMGQQYIASAILNKVERLHVQSFDLSVLYGDATRSPEAAVVQLFAEARRHKPSVIYIPNVDIWYNTVGPSVIRLFTGLLRSIPSNESVLVLGVMEVEGSDEVIPDSNLLADLFPFSKKNHIPLKRPGEEQRREYFSKIVKLIDSPPTEFPQGENRKKRDLPQLEVAPPVAAPKKELTKAELKAQKKTDRNTLNYLKIRIQPVMDHIKKQYGKFRNPPIDPTLYPYLFTEQVNILSSDLTEEQRQLQQYRPYEMAKDKKGIPGIIEVATGKFYYNLEIVTIERRLSNGYYKRPKDFLADIKRLAKDAATLEDQERTLKANVMVSNVEVDMQMIETSEAALVRECESLYLRELAREAEEEKRIAAQKSAEGNGVPILSNILPQNSGSTLETSGPVVLGEEIPGPRTLPPTAAPAKPLTNGDSMSNGHLSRPSSSGQKLSNGSTDILQRTDGNGDERVEGDVAMTDVESGHPEHPSTISSSAANTQTQRPQRSAFTPMAQGSQPADYHNSASTTTSGQKASDKSGNTQSSNGILKGDHPDFTSVQQLPGGSQLPDTQEMDFSSSLSHPSPPSQSHGAESMGPPSGVPLKASSIFLEKRTGAETTIGHSEPQPSMIHVDMTQLDEFHERLAEKTSGCSLEQLEQVNAAMMDTIWRSRGEWNRNTVLFRIQKVFNDTIKDIEVMQTILPSSGEPARNNTMLSNIG